MMFATSERWSLEIASPELIWRFAQTVET